MSQKQTVLESRYGKQRTKTGWIGITIAAVSAVTFFTFAIYASFIGKPVASVELASYHQLDKNHMEGSFTALTADKPASCVFKAYSTRGTVVGFAEVGIPANQSDAQALKVVVKTLEAATVLRTDGCSVK
jgi:hypothetical protein